MFYIILYAYVKTSMLETLNSGVDSEILNLEQLKSYKCNIIQKSTNANNSKQELQK